MSKAKDLAKNTAIIAVGRIATQLLSFVLLPLYTFVLHPEDYGKVDLITTYVLLLAPLATLQVERATFRFLIDKRSDKNASKTIITNSLSIISLCTFALVATFVLINQFMAIPLFWFALSLFVAAVYANLLQQVARGQGKNKAFTIGSIVTGISQVVAALVLVIWLKYGAAGVLAANTIANIAGCVYFVIKLKVWTLLDFKTLARKNIKSLLEYATPLVPSNIAWWVINASDRTIITLVLGVAVNGVYAIAVKLASIFSILYAIYDMSWTESVSLHINAKDKDVFFSQAMNQALRFFGSLGLLLISTLGLAFPLVVDEAYRKAYNYIPILILGALFSAVVAQYSAIYIAKMQTKKVAASSIGSALINVTLTIIGIKIIGVYAAALATAIAFMIMAIYRHFDTQKYVKITYKKGLLGSLIVAYTVIFLLYYAASTLTAALSVLLSLAFALHYNKQLLKSGLLAIKERRSTFHA